MGRITFGEKEETLIAAIFSFIGFDPCATWLDPRGDRAHQRNSAVVHPAISTQATHFFTASKTALSSEHNITNLMIIEALLSSLAENGGLGAADGWFNSALNANWFVPWVLDT